VTDIRYGDDISLYGESLAAWKEWVDSLQQTEWLLGWAQKANKAGVIISMPFWLAATVLLVPLTILDVLTLHLPLMPLRWLLDLELKFLLGTGSLWENAPGARPVLLLIGPTLSASALVLVHLIPHAGNERADKSALCELWPLSLRRLRWIQERGNGKPTGD
jgi:hypothetical protein